MCVLNVEGTISRKINASFIVYLSTLLLLKTGGRIVRFIPFPRVLALGEMLTASSKIWSLIIVSIFYDDNHYTISIHQ